MPEEAPKPRPRLRWSMGELLSLIILMAIAGWAGYPAGHQVGHEEGGAEKQHQIHVLQLEHGVENVRVGDDTIEYSTKPVR